MINARGKKTIFLLLAISIFLGSVLCDFSFAKTHIVVVVYSKNIKAYAEAFSGFKEKLKEAGHEVIYKEYYLQKDNKKELKHKITGLNPTLILALGTDAALFLKNNVKNFPILFSMVLNPIENGIVKSLNASGDNLTGICLNITVEERFRKLNQIMPNVRFIGMLYDANKMVRLKNEASQAADKLGVKLVAKPIYSRSDMSGALDSVFREADCLWADVDPLIYNPALAPHIILTALRNKIPFIAFSKNYVKAGALFALECDYFDIGSQTGELAIRIFNGEKAGSIPIGIPRKTHLIINKRTAETLGINIPRSILKEAFMFFGDK